jgi:hypothetical protein
MRPWTSAPSGFRISSTPFRRHRKLVPFDIKIYGEYAHSYKNINTFGKALVDDMESTEEVVIVSLSDKDWILSSMPAPFTQADRGRLYYRYYRDPVTRIR